MRKLEKYIKKGSLVVVGAEGSLSHWSLVFVGAEGSLSHWSLSLAEESLGRFNWRKGH